MSEHKLSAVQKGKSLFGGKSQRFPTEFFVNLPCRVLFTFIIYLSKTQKRKAHIGQGGKISRCTEGTLLIYHWINSVVIEIHKSLNRLNSRTRETVRKRFYLKGNHQPYNLLRNLLTHSASVRHHKIFLKLR